MHIIVVTIVVYFRTYSLEDLQMKLAPTYIRIILPKKETYPLFFQTI